MNQQTNKEKLSRMKLYGILRAYEALCESMTSNDLTNDEFLAHLIEAEWDERYNRKLQRLLAGAKFRYKTAVEEIDYKRLRGFTRNKMARFVDSTWIQKAENIIITGSTGVGKSFLACAFGNQGCIHGYRVLYFNCLKIFTHLKMAQGDGSYVKEIAKIKKHDLLILEDFGLQKLDTLSRLMFLEILEDRHGRLSTIITSQLPANKWHGVIGEPTIADAICDRMVHSSHLIKLEGDSLRKKIK